MSCNSDNADLTSKPTEQCDLTVEVDCCPGTIWDTTTVGPADSDGNIMLLDSNLEEFSRCSPPVQVCTEMEPPAASSVTDDMSAEICVETCSVEATFLPFFLPMQSHVSSSIQKNQHQHIVFHRKPSDFTIK